MTNQKNDSNVNKIIGGTITSPIHAVETNHEILKMISNISDSLPIKSKMQTIIDEIDILEKQKKNIEDESDLIMKKIDLSYINNDIHSFILQRKLIKSLKKPKFKLLKISNLISKKYNLLIYYHQIANKQHNRISPADFYSIVLTYEKKLFTINVFSTLQLRKTVKLYINKMLSESLLKKYEYINNININSTYKKKRLLCMIEYYKAKYTELDLKYNLFIKSCEGIQYSKLINRLDKISHNKKYAQPFIKDDNIIKLQRVNKYYYNKWTVTKALKDVNISIKKGEFVVIIGPSGSGKTTLLNIISGMDSATSGTSIIANENTIYKNNTELTQFRKQNIGYIFQQYGLIPNLTVRENVEIGWNLQTDKSKRIDVDYLLKAVGMYEFKDKYPYELSGGQQQRVSIARSMAKNPLICFGDEPTGAIDEETSKQVMQLFVEINKKFKTTVIIVTHNPIFVDLATRVIKIVNGCVVENRLNNSPKQINELNWINK